MSEKDIHELEIDMSSSPLYSEDLAPVSAKDRTWSTWHLAAIWIGMAVCIPTYLLASYMIKSGLSWIEALLIIGLSNLIITIPMVLNGHAGVKYGIPFPVIGRASFGIRGVHIASVLRGIVACGWFGIQTWIGGLAIYAIFNVFSGADSSAVLSLGHFVGFALFWLINIYFVWKGTETIKWLEEFAAPILIGMGVLLIIWGATQAGGFKVVLDQSVRLGQPSATIQTNPQGTYLIIHPLKDTSGQQYKADEYALLLAGQNTEPQWQSLQSLEPIPIESDLASEYRLQFRKQSDGNYLYSSTVTPLVEASDQPKESKIWSYILWLTAMVGFWATMAISIADITRFAKSQKAQVAGQFIGLPGTMMLYSFVGIFVTCAAVINFKDILVADDAPWDPVQLLARFESPWVVIVSQLFLLIATLSTNIAANVIAPSNAFSNLFPKHISFRMGGVITGLVGIAICPWWLLDEISSILIFISGLLGPILGILLCDYFLIRKKTMQLAELYNPQGAYLYRSGFNPAAMISLGVGIGLALAGFWIESLSFLYSFSWFTGFFVSFILYYFLMKRARKS